jgi:hypothetical protein
MSITKSFDLITFLDTGFIKIKNGETIELNQSIIGTPIGLRVDSSVTPWKVTIDTSPKAPKYKSIVPFGEGDLADIIFGKVENQTSLRIKQIPSEEDTIKFTKNAPQFYMVLKDTIGTDDMRNGKVNVNILSIENISAENNHGYAYLKLIENGPGTPTQTGAEYDLEVGYYERSIA